MRDSLTGIDLILDRIGSVPSLPLMYEQLDDAINHPRSSISDISRILSQDQGLAARILKLANSPLFGYFSRIDTITQAVTIIGIQQVRDLALAVSVMEIFSGIPENLITMEQFWKHSIACGLTARVLAGVLKEANLERFFVAGILHDIGRLALLISIPDVCREMFETSRKEHQLLHLVERERLGFDHGDLGGHLLKSWKIPGRITETVEYHHRNGESDQYPRESAILHVADVITHAMEFGFSGELFVPPFKRQAWDMLKLPVNMLALVMKQVDITFAETTAILQRTP